MSNQFDMDSLIGELEKLATDAGYQEKQANISEKDVLDGSRTDTKGGGDPFAGGSIHKEMPDNSHEMAHPTEDSYDKGVSSDYDLEKERQKKVNKNTNSVAQKAASTANYIMSKLDKLATQSKGDMIAAGIDSEDAAMGEHERGGEIEQFNRDKKAEEKKDEEDKEEEKEDEEEMDEKKAGAQDFWQSLSQFGGPYLHKVAAQLDPEYQKIASETLSTLQGEQLADFAIVKASSFTTGAQLADAVIEKVAADLVHIMPLLQNLEQKGMLNQEEREQLTRALQGCDTLSPADVMEKVKGYPNAAEISEVLIKAVEGPQGENTVPEPAQQVHEPTQPPHEAGVDGEIAGDSKDDEGELVIQASEILDKLKRCREGKK